MTYIKALNELTKAVAKEIVRRKRKEKEISKLEKEMTVTARNANISLYKRRV
jgi:hypothetical protein